MYGDFCSYKLVGIWPSALKTGEVEHNINMYATFNIIAWFLSIILKSIAEQKKEISAMHLYIVTLFFKALL